MSRVKDVCDRARSLSLRVVRSTHSVEKTTGLYRLIDGKNKVITGTNFEASPRRDIEAGLSRWESYKPPRF